MERERDQFCAHCTMSARLVNLTGSSCWPAVYSAGPLAIAMGTTLRRVPGTWPFPLRGFSLLLVSHLPFLTFPPPTWINRRRTRKPPRPHRETRIRTGAQQLAPVYGPLYTAHVRYPCRSC